MKEKYCPGENKTPYLIEKRNKYGDLDKVRAEMATLKKNYKMKYVMDKL